MEEGHRQDPCLPSPPREPIPHEWCSEQRFEQESSQSEPDLREECVREMERMACHLDTSNTIAGQDSNTQEAGHRHLGICGQRMLADWYTPRRSSVLPEAKLNMCLGKLALVSDQQSALDSGIRPDQWTLGRSQADQPFRAFKRQLIASISAQRQSQVVLMANADRLASHHNNVNNAMADAAHRAFHPIRERDLFSLGSQNTVMRELNPDHQGPLFLNIYMEQPEL